MAWPSNGIWRAYDYQTMVWLGHQMAFGAPMITRPWYGLAIKWRLA